MRVVEIGVQFSAGTMFIATIFNGGRDALVRISLILRAVDSVSLLTTKAFKLRADTVKP